MRAIAFQGSDRFDEAELTLRDRVIEKSSATADYKRSRLNFSIASANLSDEIASSR